MKLDVPVWLFWELWSGSSREVQVVKFRRSLVAVMLSYPFAVGDATQVYFFTFSPWLSWDNHSSTFVAL